MASNCIVVGVDLRERSEVAVQSALRLAKMWKVPEVHVVAVVNSSRTTTVIPYFVSDEQIDIAHQRAIAEAERRIGKLLGNQDGGEVSLTHQVTVGKPSEELHRIAEARSAKALVVSTRPHDGSLGFVLGSTSDKLVRTTTCPMLVVGTQRALRDKATLLLVPIDLSSASQGLLEHAISLLSGSKGSARVIALAVYDHPLVGDEDALLPHYVTPHEMELITAEHRKAAERLVAQVPNHGVEVQVQVIAKAPAGQVILDVAEITQPDMIVVGTRGHGVLHRMFVGSTATKVVMSAKVPVLVVPGSAEHA
jgi:nucleotide-binding universal stress UspA family protein